MGTVFLGMDFSREKFRNRAARWRCVRSYPRREVIASTECVDVVSYNIPAVHPAVKGKTIIWFSDLHFRADVFDEKVAVESSGLINDIVPDYLIYGGDVVNYSSAMPAARTFLQSLPEKSRKMALMGNWEYGKRWLKHKDWESFFDDSGFKLLINESCVIDDIYFYGIDDLRKGKPVSPANIPAGKELVFLTHSPDTFIHIDDDSMAWRTSLVLCGHTHGGQVRLPLLGALLTSSRYWRKFDYGHYVNAANNSNMIVSSGLGCSTIGVRVACRRELVLVKFV